MPRQPSDIHSPAPYILLTWPNTARKDPYGRNEGPHHPGLYRYPGPGRGRPLFGQKALDSERPPVRVVLLALDQGKFDSQRSLDELAALAEANGMQAVATVCQKRSTPEAATLLGGGQSGGSAPGMPEYRCRGRHL